MKTICFQFFLMLISSMTLYSQQTATASFEISPLAIPGSDINLSARIVTQDHYIIILTSQIDESKKIEKTVRPFELEVFKRVCKSALQEMQRTLNSSENPSFLDSLDQADLDLANIPYAQLFFQLQGIGMVLPQTAESTRPLAGELCIDWVPIVTKRLNTSFPLKPSFIEKKERAKKIEREAIEIRDSFEAKGISLSPKEFKKLKRKLYKQFSEREFIKESDELKENKVLSSLYKKMKNSLHATRMRIQSREQALAQLKDENTVQEANNRNLQDLRSWVERDLFELNRLDFNLAQRVRNILDSARYESLLYSLARDVSRKRQEPTTAFLSTPLELLHSIIDLNNEIRRLESRDITKEFKDGTIESQKAAISQQIKELTQIFQSDSIETENLKKNLKDNQKKLDVREYIPYKIKYVEIEFNEGFIEHIQVVGELDNGNKIRTLEIDPRQPEYFNQEEKKQNESNPKLVFSNVWPLGFSRKYDFNALRNVTLVGSVEGHANDKYELRLGNLLPEYEPALGVGRRDFSPENLVIRFDRDKKETCKKLYKEYTYKMLEARVFSDLAGIDPNKPNGLVQTEFSKRININTARDGEKKHYNLGALSWFEPKITLSKIENNNKYLVLNKFDSLNSQKRLISTLDTRERESFSAGVTGNLVYLDMPNYKSSFMVNFGVRYGRTPVKLDSTLTGVNSITIFPEAALDIRGDERWGTLLSIQLNRMRIFGRQFRQIADLNDPENQLPSLIKNNRWYASTQLFIYFHPSQEISGRLFFRYRYNWQIGDANLGFYQAQLGYSFYLLGQNKNKK